MYSLLLTCYSSFLFFLGFILITRKIQSNRYANRWLTVFFVSLSAAFFSAALKAADLDIVYPHIYKTLDLFAFIIAPALFLAVRYYTRPDSRFRIRELFHFLPALGFTVFISSYYFRLSGEQLSEILAAAAFERLYAGLKWALFLQGLLYIIGSIWRIRQFERGLVRYESSNKPVLRWLLYFLYGTAFLLILWKLNLNAVFANFIPLAYGLVIFYLAYFSINQEELFPYSEAGKQALLTLLEADSSAEPVGKKALLSNEALQGGMQQLSNLMEKERPYLDNELNLIRLAEMAGISARELSYIINQGFGENFSQFVNRYRIAESKRLLSDEKFSHLNMVGIAYQSGFNSKTIFNTTFKKSEGMTPTAFQKLYRG